jgi:hypothetical protein
MTTPSGEKSVLAPAPARLVKPVEPTWKPLAKLPESVAELFHTLAVPVRQCVDQPDPSGKRGTAKQDYSLPWIGFSNWKDARARLVHFEKHAKGRVRWSPFNDSTSNDGPMSLNAYPGRAFIERVTNAGDANLEARAQASSGSMPDSPMEAVERWFGLGPHALATGLTKEEALALAQKTVTVTAYVGDVKDHRDCVLDARDYGIGLTSAEMPGTILSLNRGLKKSKHYLTGKHGQGASSTYQYSDLTLIASRKVGSPKVAFTLVEGVWDEDEGTVSKTPTYRYLTIDGNVPDIDLPEAQFSAGTLVRHIGYSAADLLNPFGENSLYGLLMRSLAEPLFPVWLENYSLRAEGIKAKRPTFMGFRRHGRLIRGTVNALERAWDETKRSSANTDGGAEPQDDDPKTRMLHRASEYFELPEWDFGGRTGRVKLGKVKINYWVADPGGRSSNDVLRNWVDPDKTIIMTLDGQTHAEESRSIITGSTGAGLWAAGRYMVVQIDCNGLDTRAKYELFTSTREHAKDTPIKKMILRELITRLGFDKTLSALNTQLAAADIKQPEDGGENIAALIKKYLKAAGVSFEQLTRKIEKWTEVEEDKEVRDIKRELPPIEAQEPPTFVRWRFKADTIHLYPGQRYSYVFETDAPPSYWNPEDQTASKVKVLAHGIRYVGSGEMKGGRVRCHFHCPDDAPIGLKGLIQVQLEFAVGEAKMHRVPVEVIAKPAPKPKPTPTPPEVDPPSGPTKTIRVKVRKKDFSEVDIPVVRPIPVTRSDSHWVTLGWPHDVGKAGFSIRAVGGTVHLYYNAEFPPFLDLRRKMSKKSLEHEFVKRYEIKLILHTIFTLNYDFVDEEDFPEEQRKRIRNLLCATAESLALATKSEIEIEAKVKSEEGPPLETVIATSMESTNLQETGASN